MRIAAIYARVSSEQQREANTIASQTASLIEFAKNHDLEVPKEWVFEDDGYSGATLERPGLEGMRDLAAEGQIQVVLAYAPDRLSRKYAYQILLIEELARNGVETLFVKAPQGSSAEDQLLVQFQGMIAEYERAQILERSRRGKRHRAQSGEVSVMSGAPYGYRYVRKTDEAPAAYVVLEAEARVVQRIYEMYTVEGLSIGEITRRINAEGIPTRKASARWERSTVWAVLRNSAYRGVACFGKTRASSRTRVLRPQRRRGVITPSMTAGHERPREEWIEIPVPALVSEDSFARAQELLQENKIRSRRRTIEPSIVQGLVSCEKCGYAFARTSTRTSARKIHYYKCIGSDSWRKLGGPVCDNGRFVRQDLLDQIVWDEVIRLLEDPTLIQQELDRRLEAARSSNPTKKREQSLQRELTHVGKGIERLLSAYQEALMSIEQLRERMPTLRQREQSVRAELQAITDQADDRATFLRLAETLGGKLQFLFIAPERLRVAGFPEMLAKRKPSLIAIDEAHCISQWGHDFRPDYRMLGQYLPGLRPAPMLALTATATTLVQNDIATQLGLTEPAHFIHGFRRENIGIELVEALPSQRPQFAREILLEDKHRPAIVYTPTRKQADAMAEEWASEFAVAVYHAGLDAERRRQVQEEFMAGKLDVMVATTAFGMGIDKTNIRTVIHTALPGSLEGYYQEIGRAGRDGKTSRAILMHSYGDRHTHDFFFSRDYPAVPLLDRVFASLRTEPQPKEALRKSLAMEEELFDKIIEKLWIHKGAVLDFAENVSQGEGLWRASYILQGEQKRAQIDQMIRFAESNQCRMTSLVRHFGDTSDSARACGVCDFCAPAKCVAQRFRTATEEERTTLHRVLRALQTVSNKSTGKLHAELCPGGEMSRDNFEEVLGAMARAELIKFADAVFEKQGKQIPYRTVSLTPAGRATDQTTPVLFVMKDAGRPVSKRKRQKKSSKSNASPNTTGRTQSRPPRTRTAASEPEKETRIEEALRAWRLSEAKRRNIPAFRIFGDRALKGIATNCPHNDAELLAVPGIGMSIVQKYGAHIYRLIAGSR